MTITALLSRAVGSKANSFGRITHRQIILNPVSSAFAAFATSGTSTPKDSHSNKSFPGRIRSSVQGNVACFGTASSDGDHRSADIQDMTVKELKDRLREEGLSTSGLKAELIGRLSASKSADALSFGKKASSKPPPQSPKRKFTINPNWQKEFNAKALTDVFDSMAKKEGFDGTLA
jgi:hypothetical protein